MYIINYFTEYDGDIVGDDPAPRNLRLSTRAGDKIPLSELGNCLPGSRMSRDV